MRKSSKDCRAVRASLNSRIQAEADAAIKAPLIMSFSARMPAYTYTSLCPDPKLRKRPGSKPEHLEGIMPALSEKICLTCRKHWPSDCKRETCDCESKGHLFSAGLYYQRKK